MVKDAIPLDIPDASGVYFWRDQDNTILYIGKATSLKSRIRSYFLPDLIHTRGPHIVDMVHRAHTITWQCTDSVLEAVIVEANLIKKYQPYYNTKEKDDKSFNCVVITKEEIPRVVIARQKDIDTVHCTVTIVRQGILAVPYDSVFGPFPQSTSLRDAVKIIRKIFPFFDRASSQKDARVFYRQISLAPDISTEKARAEYKKNIQCIKKIFQGSISSVRSMLEKEMMQYAKKEAFEEAQTIKQKLLALDHIQDVALIKRDTVYTNDASIRIEAYDIAHTSGAAMVGVMVLIDNGRPDTASYRTFSIRGFTKSNDVGALTEMVTRRLAHTEWPYPDAIVVDGNMVQLTAVRDLLEKAEISIPVLAVTKDEHHRPKAIIGKKESDTVFIAENKLALLLANAEAHRFAVRTHQKKRALHSGFKK